MGRDRPANAKLLPDGVTEGAHVIARRPRMRHFIFDSAAQAGIVSGSDTAGGLHEALPRAAASGWSPFFVWSQ